MTPNVLIVRFSSIGDLLLTTPLLRAIKTRHPGSRITFVTRADMVDTLRHNPRIDRLVAWRRGTSLGHLAAGLRQEEWTHRLDLHGSLRSRLLRQLVGGTWRGYPKHRVRRRLLITTHLRRGGTLGHVADRYFQAARDLDVRPDGGPAEFFTLPEADVEAAQFLADHALGEERPLIAFAPGAAHLTKRWPTRHWSELARQLAADRDIVVVGGTAEQDVAGEIVAAAGAGAASAAGRYSLAGTAALLKRAGALVAGDTGALHLATAVGTPVVGLYGPTVEQFGFFPYHARTIAVQHDLDCRPCSSKGGPACPLGHHNCLVRMMPVEVMEAVEAIAGASQ